MERPVDRPCPGNQLPWGTTLLAPKAHTPPAVLAGGCALRRTTRGGLTQDLVHARREDMLGHRADDGVSHLPLVEEHEGGNARDAIALGHRGVLVDVELAHRQTSRILGRDLLHHRSYETART